MAEIRIKSDKIEVSTKYLCDLLNVSRETLTNWRNDGCPQVARGWWNLIQVLQWRGILGNRILTEVERDELSLNERKMLADIELKEGQGELVRLELRQKQNELHEAADVERVLSGMITVSRNLLLAVPIKAAPRLLGLSLLDDIKEIFGQYSEKILSAKTQGELERIIDNVLDGELKECSGLAEINIVISSVINDALKELSEYNPSLFAGGEKVEEEYN